MKLLTLVSFLTVLSLPIASSAQTAGAPNLGAAGRQDNEPMTTRDTMSQADLKRLAEQLDQWSRVEKNGTVSPRVAKARTAAMLAVLNVPCEVSEAAYQGSTPDKSDQHVYEAACEDGMGYLLLLQGTDLRGISCLATGRESAEMKCALPANADGRVIAGRVLSRNQIDCKVRDIKWLGTSASKLDHVEVACENGDGYMMRSPRIGSSGKLEVFGCQDAIKNGVACELSSQAAPAAGRAVDSRPSLEWFKEALTRNGVSCVTKRARIVGRESIKRRYLVEFECSDRPEGLMAFVPPVGDTANAFESMNCEAAAKRGIRCEWMPAEDRAGASNLKP